MDTLKSILIQYANERGGGLPLTPQEVCNAVVLWCQNFVREKYPDISVSDPLEVSKVVFDDKTIFNISLPYGNISNVVKTVVDAFYLSERIEGSETIIVDINESGDGIEIHLDSEVVSKIERAILLPLQAPQVPSIPVVGVNNAVEYAPITDFTSGGSKLYLHKINFGIPVADYYSLTFIANVNTAFNTWEDFWNFIAYNKDKILNFRYMTSPIIDYETSQTDNSLTVVYFNNTRNFTDFQVNKDFYKQDVVTEL